VERKLAEPRAGFGPIVSAFANTAGGWLLLGIGDRNVDGEAPLADFTTPGRADLRDWLRDKLTAQLGEVPYFRAELLSLRGHEIGVVHVPQSPAAPHFMNDGRVFVRENGRTVVITLADQLRQLLARSDASIEAAAERLARPGTAQAAEAALGMPRTSNALSGRSMPIILRAAPAYVPPALQRELHSRRAVARSEAFVLAQAAALHDRPHRDRPYASPELHPGGHSVTTSFDGHWWQRVTVAQDSRGVIGMRMDGTNQDGVYLFVDERLRSWFAPTLAYFADSLSAADAIGPATLHLAVGGISGTSVFITGKGDFGFPVSAGNWFDVTMAWEQPTDVSAHEGAAESLITAMARSAGALIYEAE